MYRRIPVVCADLNKCRVIMIPLYHPRFSFMSVGWICFAMLGRDGLSKVCVDLITWKSLIVDPENVEN